MEFHLGAEVQAHRGAGRALDAGNIQGRLIIASGGLDGLVYGWSLETVADLEKADGPLSFVRSTELCHHTSPVYSVAVHPQVDAIYSGSQKGAITESGSAGCIQGHFNGHTKPVNSLCVWGGNRLLSGAWDATARVWDSESRSCVATLEGPHAYAVTVAPVDDQKLLTGSQNGKLVLWENNRPIQEIADAHQDIIRAISPITNWPGHFVTCSNDGFVRLWKLMGDRLRPLNIEGVPRSTHWTPGGSSDVLLFDARGYSIEDGPVIVAVGGDDGSLRVGAFARTKEDLSLISDELLWTHISSVWAVRFIANSDARSYPELLSACGDGCLRLFTADPSRAMKADVASALRAQSVATVEAARAQQTQGAMDLSKLPRLADKATIRGRMAGQTKLFVNGAVVEVHQWTGSEWQKVGDMVAPPSSDTMSTSTELYEGDDFFPAGQYDFVFYVEIESKGSSRSKLPFRLTENPMEVAERFCAREQIGKHNVPDIIKFIEANAGLSKAAPYTSASMSQPSPSASPSVMAPSPASAQQERRHEALQTMMPTLFAAGVKWEKPLEKIIELNKEQKEEVKLKSHEIPNLMTLRSALENPVFDKEKIGSRDLAMLLTKHSWNEWEPKEAQFPWFDIMRKVACNNTTADYFRRNVKGRENVTFVVQYAKAVDALNSSSPVPMLIFRYLANISSWVSTRDYFVQDFPHIVSLLRTEITPVGAKYEFATPTQRNALNALLTFLLNIAIGINAQSKSSLTISSANARQMLRRSIDQMVEYAHDLVATEHGVVKQSGDVGMMAVCLVIAGMMMSTQVPNETPSPRVVGLAKEVERLVAPLVQSPTLVQAQAIQAIQEAAL